MLVESLPSGAKSTTVRSDPQWFLVTLVSNLSMAGDILHASAFGNHVVVVNSLKMAEIFEERAQLYSDRPVIPVVELYAFLSTGRSMH